MNDFRTLVLQVLQVLGRDEHPRQQPTVALSTGWCSITLFGPCRYFTEVRASTQNILHHGAHASRATLLADMPILGHYYRENEMTTSAHHQRLYHIMI